MRFIRYYLLQYKLAKLFKLAEQATEKGIESGEQIYVDLYDQAGVLVGQFNNKTIHPITMESFPALVDLEKLTIKPEPVDIRPVIVKGIAICFGSVLALGFVAACINISYQGWMGIFHLLHLAR